MKRLSILLALLSVTSLHAELPPAIASMLKQQADQYAAAMKAYDANVEALVKIDRDAYLILLEAARKREAGARRPKRVAALDAEIQAFKTGVLTGDPPADMPDDPILLTRRKRCVTAAERAAKAVEQPRRHARDSYVKWLDGMLEQARRGKSAELEAAVTAEKARVAAGGKP